MFNSQKRKSLERKAWFVGSVLCQLTNETAYNSVRHRLQQGAGVATKVKLSSKGWSAGGGRKMPSTFFTLDDVVDVEPDPIYHNVLLCVFRGINASDFPYQIVAYKFDSGKSPTEFQQLFQNLQSRTKTTTTTLNKPDNMMTAQPAVLHGTTNKLTTSHRMPGRHAHLTTRHLTPGRWAARDRVTPKLFTSRSVDDLANELSKSFTSYKLSTDTEDTNSLISDDVLEVLGTNVNNYFIDWSKQHVTFEGCVNDRLLTANNDTCQGNDGNWWKEHGSDVAIKRMVDKSVAAALPAASDVRRHERLPGLELLRHDDVIDTGSRDVACQVYVMQPLRDAKISSSSATSRDDEIDEFKWVFSDDEDDECNIEFNDVTSDDGGEMKEKRQNKSRFMVQRVHTNRISQPGQTTLNKTHGDVYITQQHRQVALKENDSLSTTEQQSRRKVSRRKSSFSTNIFVPSRNLRPTLHRQRLPSDGRLQPTDKSRRISSRVVGLHESSELRRVYSADSASNRHSPHLVINHHSYH